MQALTPKFFFSRLDSWGHEPLIKEAVGTLGWRKYIRHPRWNVWAIYRTGGTYSPAMYVTTYDRDSNWRVVKDIRLVDDLPAADVSEIVNLLTPHNLPLDPTKILAREDYELMAAIGAKKDDQGVYRIGINRDRPESKPSDPVYTKEQLFGSR